MNQAIGVTSDDTMLDTRMLLRGLAEQERGFGYLFRNRYTYFVLSFFAATIAVAIIWYSIKHFVVRRWCPRLLQQEDRRHQAWHDRQVAARLQREMAEEDREQERIERRNERRKWYRRFLMPYTMTIGEDNFVEPSAIGNKSDRKSDSSGENNEHTVVEHQNSSTSDRESRCLRLPPKEEASGESRFIFCSCTICLKDYEVGDEIVWAATDTNDCPHAFHKDCIITWLSRGKKRCPNCRQWFVPPARIADQKKAFLEQHPDDSDDEEEEDVADDNNNGDDPLAVVDNV